MFIVEVIFFIVQTSSARTSQQPVLSQPQFGNPKPPVFSQSGNTNSSKEGQTTTTHGFVQSTSPNKSVCFALFFIFYLLILRTYAVINDEIYFVGFTNLAIPVVYFQMYEEIAMLRSGQPTHD